MAPREFAAIVTPSAFRAVLNECPSSGLQFLLDRLDELYGFKLAVNGHAALLQLAPGQDGDLVNPVLPLHIASISLVFKDPGDCHPRGSAYTTGAPFCKWLPISVVGPQVDYSAYPSRRPWFGNGTEKPEYCNSPASGYRGLDELTVAYARRMNCHPCARNQQPPRPGEGERDVDVGKSCVFRPFTLTSHSHTRERRDRYESDRRVAHARSAIGKLLPRSRRSH